MRSDYKQLKSYIREVKLRNSDLAVSELRGVKINKEFMPSVANIQGTDMSKYKVVSKWQFAYNPMHVGRDEVLPIALHQNDEPIIVSPAYVVFEIKDHSQLLPEYLMMWCRRTEFDRNAWFTTDSSVRGGFSWESMCEMELPIPTIEKQREIVKEYNTIVDRIKLNEQLNQKLEETAQAIYKHWFADFEFPISPEYAASIGKPELEGQPYKSSGGEMEWNEELEREVPKGWRLYSLSDFIKIIHGFAFKGDYITSEPNNFVLLTPGNFKIGGGFKSHNLRYYVGDVPKDYIFQSGDLMVTMTDLSKAADTLGYPAFIPEMRGLKYLHNQRIGRVIINGHHFKYFIYHLMCSTDYRNEIVGGATGTTVKHTSPSRIESFEFMAPSDEQIFKDFAEISKCVHQKINEIIKENELSYSMRQLLNTRMSKSHKALTTII